MNKHLVLSSVCLGFALTAPAAFANDKVASTYDANRYMQVCKGKSQGDHVSFAYRGIIWNGTCQPQFFASNKGTLMGDEAEIYRTCKGASGMHSAMINGKEVKGKCALGFTAPQPK
jgi:hypothetical protein